MPLASLRHSENVSGRPGRRGRILGVVAFALAAAVTVIPALGAGPAGSAGAATGTSGVTLVFLNPQKDHLAVPGIVVALVPEGGGDTVTATSDSTGRVGFRGLSSGDWDAVITPPQAGSATRVPVRIDGLALAAGQVVYKGVVLRIGASIGGTLRNGYGAELPNVAVVIRVGKTPAVVGRAVTESRGHFWFRGVASGSYSLQYNPPQGIPRPHETANETWSFWGHTPGTAFSFALIHVVNATAGNVQTVFRNGDGVLVEGSRLATDVRPQGTTNLSKATITYAGEGLGSTFTFPVFGADSRGAYGFARVVPGRDKVSVTGTSAAGAPVTYYYTGETTAPSLSSAAARWVTFTDEATVTFIRTP